MRSYIHTRADYCSNANSIQVLITQELIAGYPKWDTSECVCVYVRVKEPAWLLMWPKVFTCKAKGYVVCMPKKSKKNGTPILYYTHNSSL